MISAVSALAACSSEDPLSGQAAPSGREAISPLLDALGEQLAKAGEGQSGNRVESPRWPLDLRFHPATQAESIELLAVVYESVPDDLAADDAQPIVLMQRFDRLKVPFPGNARSADGSDFNFRDVVRSSGSVNIGTAARGRSSLTRHDTIARATLGLATASTSELMVRDASIRHVDSSGDVDVDTEAGVEAELEPLTEHEAADVNASLGESDDNGKHEGGGQVRISACSGHHYRFERGVSDLHFMQEDCPSASVSGGLAVSVSPSLPVTGWVDVSGIARQVAGHGYVRRAWGAAPPVGGAVAFDRLVVELEGSGTLELSRSKRRSGRGPKITSASFRRSVRARGDPVEVKAPFVIVKDLEWTDGFASLDPGAGETYGLEERPTATSGAPEQPMSGSDKNASGEERDTGVAWYLRSASLGIDVRAVPLLAAPVADTPLGRVWAGAVEFSGSHQGLGFIEFNVLGDREADAFEGGSNQWQ